MITHSSNVSRSSRSYIRASTVRLKQKGLQSCKISGRIYQVAQRCRTPCSQKESLSQSKVISKYIRFYTRYQANKRLFRSAKIRLKVQSLQRVNIISYKCSSKWPRLLPMSSMLWPINCSNRIISPLSLSAKIKSTIRSIANCWTCSKLSSRINNNQVSICRKRLSHFWAKELWRKLSARLYKGLNRSHLMMKWMVPWRKSNRWHSSSNKCRITTILTNFSSECNRLFKESMPQQFHKRVAARMINFQQWKHLMPTNVPRSKPMNQSRLHEAFRRSNGRG